MSAAERIRQATANRAGLTLEHEAGVALADLLDALHTALREGWDGARIDYLAEWRRLEAAINGSDEPFAAALEQAITGSGQ